MRYKTYSKKESLPYSKSKTDIEKSEQRIKRLLKRFGVDMVSIVDNYREKSINVVFEFHGYPVSIPINYGDIAQSFYESDPIENHRNLSRKITEDEWIKQKEEIAHSASFSMLEDLLKSIITMIDRKSFLFEEIFISFFVNKDGRRIGEELIKYLPNITGIKQLNK